MNAEELANEISNFVNGASVTEVEKLAELMSQDHPTLQQSKMRLACMFIEFMANKAYVDARNEQSKSTAIAMISGFKQKVKEDSIKLDGEISDSYSKYIDEKVLPSKNLGCI
jgi:hypothetical protein